MEELPAETTDKAAAFEQARRKFAAYSRSGGGRTSRDSSVEASGISRLRTPASLQVDGELAAQLEEADYLLTGVLDASHRGSDADGAMAMNVVKLASLMQSRALRSVLVFGKSDSPCDLCARLQQVLRLLLPSRLQDTGDEDRAVRGDSNRDISAASESDLVRLSLSVLAYSLTLDAEVAAVLVDERAFTAIVGALKAETDAIAVCQRSGKTLQTPPALESVSVRSGHVVNASAAGGHQGDVVALQGPSTDAKPPLKKSCLKRKRTEVETSTFHQDGVAATDNGMRLKILASSDAAVRSRLHALVDGDPTLVVVSNHLCLSAADVLCATLHNLLQIENPVNNEVRAPQDANFASRLGDRDGKSSSRELSPHSPREQPEAMVSLDQRRHGVHEAFKTTRNRKAWLVRSGALNTLLQALQLRLSPLVDVVQPQSSNICSLKEECDPADIKIQQFALHRLSAVLQVLEQAAFFARNVQHRLSTSRELFAMLLGVVQVLGDICWGSNVLWTSSSIRECATVAVEVFLAAMRLLINLTHQNAAADAHISSLNGMRVLFDMFCHLWYLREDAGIGTSRSAQAVAEPSSPTRQSVMIEEKLVFDAYLLLLSGMVNCVENSKENRGALSQLTPAAPMTIRGEVPASVCSILTQFFLDKVQSYKTLIDGSSKTCGADGGINESEDTDWSPDDVILGGCSALLLGCLMSNSSDNVDAVLAHLPGGSPRLLLRALAVFVALHAQIGALTPEVAASVLRVETALNRVMLQTPIQPRRWRVQPPLADEMTTHEFTRPSEQEEDSAKTTTPSQLDIISPNRATRIVHSKPSDVSPSSARAAQRRRNLCASLSDSDEESGTHSKQESIVMSAVIDSSDGGRQLDEATSASAEVASGSAMQTWSSPVPKSPPRSRCSNRSSPSSFRTPSPNRRQRTPKSSERQHFRASGGVASASSTSRRLLKEARNLIEDLDAELARSGGPPVSSPSFHPRMQSSFSTCETSLASGSSEQWSRDRDEDSNSERAIAGTTEVAACRVLELVGSKDTPVFAKTTEKKRKRKDYRLPTSPFRHVRHPPSSGDLRSGVSSIFQQLATTNSEDLPSTPEHSTEAAHSTPLRHQQPMSAIRIDQSPTSASHTRRKLKGVRVAPPPLAAAIFNFDE
jgi:hypothetical protein